MKKKLSYTVCFILLVFLIISCRKEPLPGISQNGDIVELEFKFGMPLQQASPGTYAISTIDENAIRRIILLAFKVSGGSETFEYYRTGMQIFSGSAANEKSFYTKLPKSENTYRFVLLINSGEDLFEIVDTISVGRTKAQVMELLVTDVAGKWNAASSLNFDPLPMWGQSGEVTGINAQTVLPSIKMLRGLARIDIKLGGDALNNFSISSVNIYNASNKVRMTPLPANYDEGNNLVIAPSIPAGTSASLDFVYEGFGSVTSLEREIYLAESNAGSTRIVVGGIYDTDIVPTYYEANLGTAILRNTRYIINITRVSVSGALLPEAALSSLPVSDRNIADKSKVGDLKLRANANINFAVSVIPANDGGLN